jgi:two-component system, OmpR family, response regulator ResD
MTRILVIEDDRAISIALQASLTREGLDCVMALNGPDGLRLAIEGFVDAILLDVMLPGMDGRDVCRQIRKRWPNAPIIMLTARGHELDIVSGLHAGADDYIVKPFAFEELMARIEAVTRRRHPDRPAGGVARVGNITVDSAARVALKNGAPMSLSRRDFDIFWYFLQHAGRLVTRDELRPLIGDDDGAAVSTRVLDTYVWRLRRLIEDDPHQPHLLETVHGRGYIFRATVTLLQDATLCQ